MTRVYLRKNNGEYIISINGHADDVRVCAGVSTLLAALEGWLSNSGLWYRYREGDGMGYLSCTMQAQTAMEMFYTGLMRLNATAPEHIAVIGEL